ncbi:hypothetical protein [Jeotgalicoccus sp. WY2]|uniref:hypothetical protein n=1 Tax=Jeotgalicoccus sp. WY2 TaxID=2708346 RepID=UPI00352FFC73
MKKFLSFTLALALSVILGACSSEEPAGEESSKEETITYESEFGPVEVPENPERIVV